MLNFTSKENAYSLELFSSDASECRSKERSLQRLFRQETNQQIDVFHSEIHRGEFVGLDFGKENFSQVAEWVNLKFERESSNKYDKFQLLRNTC